MSSRRKREKTVSVASHVRILARDILQGAGGEMGVGELLSIINKKRALPLIRKDFLIVGVTATSSGMEVRGETNCQVARIVGSSNQSFLGVDAHYGARLTTAAFVVRSIKTLRKPPYKGILAARSGFTNAFREYFPRLNVVETVKKLAEAGFVHVQAIRGIKHDVLLLLPEDKPLSAGEKALQKMGLQTTEKR